MDTSAVPEERHKFVSSPHQAMETLHAATVILSCQISLGCLLLGQLNTVVGINPTAAGTEPKTACA